MFLRCFVFAIESMYENKNKKIINHVLIFYETLTLCELMAKIIFYFFLTAGDIELLGKRNYYSTILTHF